MIASALVRLGTVAVLWLAATELAASALGYGLVAVPVVAAMTYVLVPRRRRGGRTPGAAGRRVRGILIILELAGWILGRSVVGGIDVAQRAVRLPRTDIDPRWSFRATRWKPHRPSPP